MPVMVMMVVVIMVIIMIGVMVMVVSFFVLIIQKAKRNWASVVLVYRSRL